MVFFLTWLRPLEKKDLLPVVIDSLENQQGKIESILKQMEVIFLSAVQGSIDFPLKRHPQGTLTFHGPQS